MSAKTRERLETWLLTTVVALLVWLYAEGEIVKQHSVEVPVQFVAPPGRELAITPDRPTDERGVMQVVVTLRASSGQMQDFRRQQTGQPLTIRVDDPASAEAGREQVFFLREELTGSRLTELGLSLVETEPETVEVHVEWLTTDAPPGRVDR